MKYELKLIKAQGFGSVNIASITGLVGYPSVSGYVAGKHGQVGLTKAATLDHPPVAFASTPSQPDWSTRR